jgi:ABC-2 type transport system ATP-binding protein
MLEVESLTKYYGSFPAAIDINFTVQPGQVLGLVGLNGSGKTTTLRCCAGIIPQTEGFVRIAGHNVWTDPVAAKQELAWFTDEPRLFDYLTVWQHLQFTARVYQLTDWETRAQQLLEELDLAPVRDELPGALSRGMKQKAVLACGFLHTPKVMLFDEPLTGLDPIAIRTMKGVILRQASAGAAIVLSSHIMHLVEEVCSHVIVLHAGQRRAYGNLDQIRQEYAPDGVNLEEIFFRIVGQPSPPDTTTTSHDA